MTSTSLPSNEILRQILDQSRQPWVRNVDRRLKIALIVESSRAYGRGVLRGIAQYAKAFGPWVLNIEERTLGGAAPKWLQGWDGDGIIARVEGSHLEKALIQTGVPVIDVRGTRTLPMPVIDTDNRLVSEQAIDHLLGRGFRELAFCGYGGLNYSELRLNAFINHCKKRGIPHSIYESPKMQGAHLHDIEQQGAHFEEGLFEWIRQLNKPVGLMACNDIRSQQVLNICRTQAIPTPEEVGIIGVDNDELLCELSDPTLSSVEPDTEKIGYEAARLLERMIKEDLKTHERFFIAPKGVVERDSTNSIAIEDPLVAKALYYIRNKIPSVPTIEEVAKAVFTSRRTLERRFQKALGCSPNEEITRLRIDRIKDLLRTTNLSLYQIAAQCGFDHPEYMSVQFKKKTGQTPGEYRKEASQLDPKLFQ